MNFVVVVIDGLRADHLSCYGYNKPTSPAIDSLAANGILFSNFFTPVTPTQPAITTLFTGQFPSTHRIIAQSGRNSLSRRAPWLPEILNKNGFFTVSVDSLPSEKRWFARGFDTVLDIRKQARTRADWFQINSLALEKVKRKRGSPFFLFLHYFHTHTPYTPGNEYLSLFYQGDPTAANRGSLDAFYRRPLRPELVTDWLMPYAQTYSTAKEAKIEDLGFARSLYDAAIRTADDAIAHLMESLDGLRLLDETALIVHADHGHELGEHGIFFDQHGLYDSTIRIPMIVRWPHRIRPGIRADTMHQTTDIAPTVLALAGLPVHEAFEGQSLVPYFDPRWKGKGYDHILSAESTWMAKWAYRTNRHKVIVAREPDFYDKPRVEVYDLLNDPAEQTNLAAVDPSLCVSLKAQLESAVSKRGVDVVSEHGIVRGFDSYYVDKTLGEFKRPLFAGLTRVRAGQIGPANTDPNPAGIIEWRYPECKAFLDHFAPRIGAYEWQLHLLRERATKTGTFPIKLYGRLRRLTRRTPPRPYFVGKSPGGVLFLGDFRDSFSVACAVVPEYNHVVTTLLTRYAQARPAGFVDVGTNLGVVAAAVARELRGVANVYAFEPHPETAQRAAATFALNRLTNVRLYQCAAGKTDGWGDLYYVNGGSAIASLRMTDLLGEHRDVRKVRVVQRTLGSMAGEFHWEEIGLLKIDVEGNESEVLSGASQLINTFKPFILYENNPRTQAFTSDCSAELTAISPGYLLKSVAKDGTLKDYDSKGDDDGADTLCIPVQR